MKAAQEGRAKGMTYRAIADLLQVDPTAVFYALNPEKRRKVSQLGRQRSVFLSDEVWEWVRLAAERRGVSRSQALSDLVQREREYETKALSLDGV